ncbi:MAG: type II secretion system F family protein [Phycisphaerae bacterium]|nr:type II secretion system F family protein [Phycisphaerae bacterium]
MSTLAFRYKALDKSGLSRAGSLHASTAQEAFRRISALGMTPVSIAEDQRASRRRGPRIKAGDISHFTQQLSVLINARLPLSDALISIAEQERNSALRQVISDIAVRIESGEPLASAIAAHASVFGDVYVQTVRAAEQSGNLISILDHLAEMLEKESEMSRQWRGAMMYPACVVAVLVLAVAFLVGFVIPKFAGIFESRGVALPLITRVLMSAGQSMQAFWWAWLAALAMIAVGGRAAWRTPRGRNMIERLLHKVPLLSTMLTGSTISRFTRIFGLTLGSGLPLTDCLVLAGRATSRPTLQQDVRSILAQVTRGAKMSEAFVSCTYLTPFAKRMLSVGEESAELTRMCRVVSRHYDQETSYLAKTLTTIIEPVLVVAIAGVVLVVALAVFLPMWDMVNLIK